MSHSGKRFHFKWHYLLFLLLIPLIAVIFYLNTSYHPSDYAKSYMDIQGDATVANNHYIHFEPQNSNGKGIIFYPGGKVDPESYAPILSALSDKGYDCFIVKMPFNLAVFNSNGAMDVVSEFDDIKTWYIAGHSLGGVMAANCVLTNPDTFDGIVFLAAYPAENKSLKSLPALRTLSFYGSEDGFVPLDSQSEHLNRLPKSSKVILLQGGNHSQFGSYGFQKGDLPPTISEEEQHQLIVDGIDLWIQEN